MSYFRKTLFWLHLAAGLIVGLVVAIMAFTGVVLAYEDEIIAWTERDVRRVSVPAEAKPLPLDELIARVRAVAPSGAPDRIAVSRDPADAVAVFYNGNKTYYANPYTGKVIQAGPSPTRDFMNLMLGWHRQLSLFTGKHRETGQAITGACNAAFLALILTGAYLWWPRKWTWRIVRPLVSFVKAYGRFRDWNWHNVIGFWLLPVLIVISASGLVISYRWANTLINRVAGDPPPQSGRAAPAKQAAIASPQSAPVLGYGAVLAHIQSAIPAWDTITIRVPAPRPAAPAANPASPAPVPGPPPFNAWVRTHRNLIDFIPVQLGIDPITGEIIKRLGYAEQPPAIKLRLWFRFLHTGQALGKPGQFVAGLGCLGGLVLVYTGFALSWRRFFPKRDRAKAT